MTTRVRLFTHRGLASLPVVRADRDTTDAVYVLDQPYLSAELMVVGETPVASSDALAPAGASVLAVQVEDGRSVHIEINPPGQIASAGPASPVVSGSMTFFFLTGWTVSAVEALDGQEREAARRSTKGEE